MSIFALMPIKDEADRYLQSCLNWLRPMVDEICVYDDRSTDDSVEVADFFHCQVKVRPPDRPSFLEHEGYFRADSWQWLVESCRPEVGDWILCNDADEFLVAQSGRESNTGSEVIGPLRSAVAQARTEGVVGIVLPVPEVFAISDGRPYVRTDGYWGTIAGPRLFAYRPLGDYNPKAMGSGAEPLYVGQGPLERSMRHGLSLMHYGYADKTDVAIKHERYSTLVEHGHNNAHIQSIIQPPHLEAWQGPIPNVWRGTR